MGLPFSHNLKVFTHGIFWIQTQSQSFCVLGVVRPRVKWGWLCDVTNHFQHASFWSPICCSRGGLGNMSKDVKRFAIVRFMYMGLRMKAVQKLTPDIFPSDLTGLCWCCVAVSHRKGYKKSQGNQFQIHGVPSGERFVLNLFWGPNDSLSSMWFLKTFEDMNIYGYLAWESDQTWEAKWKWSSSMIWKGEGLTSSQQALFQRSRVVSPVLSHIPPGGGLKWWGCQGLEWKSDHFRPLFFGTLSRPSRPSCTWGFLWLVLRCASQLVSGF